MSPDNSLRSGNDDSFDNRDSNIPGYHNVHPTQVCLIQCTGYTMFTSMGSRQARIGWTTSTTMSLLTPDMSCSNRPNMGLFRTHTTSITTRRRIIPSSGAVSANSVYRNVTLSKSCALMQARIRTLRSHETIFTSSRYFCS